MNIYQTNRNWSDQFLPQIKRIVGSHLLETSPDPLDWHQATDLLMLDARDMRIAASVYADPVTPTQIPASVHHPLSRRLRGRDGAQPR